MKFVYVNMMEELIVTRLEEIIDSIDCCKCEKCLMDIVALTLNQLPAKYVATDQGKVICKLKSSNLQDEVMILSLIMRSVAIVKEHPRH